MKILKYLIIPFLVFLFSFSVHAQAAPDLSQHTYELIDNGAEMIFQTMGTEHGIYNTLGSYEDIIRDILGLSPVLKPSDYSIRPLTDIEKENLEDGFTTHFYDSEGNEISINDLYYVTADNSFMQAEFYIDSNGNILYDSPYDSHTLLNLKVNPFLPMAGITGQTYNSWSDVYNDLIGRIESNNFNYSAPDVDLTDNSYFLWVPYGGNTAGYVYIANQYNPGVSVPVTNQNGGQIQQWYTNDLSTIVFSNTKGDISSQLQISSGSWSKLGNTYRYRVTFMPSSGYGSIALGSYQTWLNQGGNFIFARQGYWYDGNRYKSSVPFIRTDVPEVPLINPDEWYNYDELTVINDVPDAAPDLNPSYNPNSPVDPSNYPFEYPAPSSPYVPSTLPLPGSQPGINPSPMPGDDTIADLDPEGTLPDSIPIIDNLQYRFPFSIPWDIKKLLQGLRSTPEAPCFSISWYIEPLDYTWNFDIDLSDFNFQAELFRTLFLISFIIGLAIFSYNHFFGS